MISHTKIQDCVQDMLSYVERADYAGYDPYDALNSPLIRRLAATSGAVGIGATQLLRCSPWNLRPILGIRRGHNPKGIGLFLWGYSKLYSITKESRYLGRLDYLLDLLDRLKSKGYSGNCWGYDFDWKSRTLFRPQGTPTIVNTSFIGHGLLDCYDLTGKAKALEMAIPIKEFILRDLHRTTQGDSFCFSYTPIDHTVVHNANLLGASVLARLARYCDDDRLTANALASMKYSMRYQREDGSWYYADTDKQRWIDSFHTGFNCQAIRYILNAGLAQEYGDSYRKGVDFYARNFFLDDGTPKYYHDRVYPVDIHSPAQAICFFAGEENGYRDLTDRILCWMLRHMNSGRGYFYYRRGRLLTNRISYMRWSQAWVFLALTEYLRSCCEAPVAGGLGERGTF